MVKNSFDGYGDNAGFYAWVAMLIFIGVVFITMWFLCHLKVFCVGG